MFRLPFKNFGPVITRKNLHVIRKEFFFEIFCENHPTTRRIEFKVIPSNKSIMANKLPSTILERFLRRIESLLTR